MDFWDELGARSAGESALLSSSYHLFLIAAWNEDMMARTRAATVLCKVALNMETMSWGGVQR